MKPVVLRVYCPSGARHEWRKSGAGRYKDAVCAKCSSVLSLDEMLALYINACAVGDDENGAKP